MNVLETIAIEIGTEGGWQDEHGSLWLRPGSLDVRRMAVALREDRLEVGLSLDF